MQAVEGLDQMVYSGHPEQAALAFVKAHNRLNDAAHDYTPPPDDEPADPEDESDPEDDGYDPDEDEATGAPSPPAVARPWQATPIAEERQRQAEAALAASGAPIHGTFERRHRFAEMRRRRDGSTTGWGADDP